MMRTLSGYYVWHDCPFRDVVPSIYKIRHGKHGEDKTEMLLISCETKEQVLYVSVGVEGAIDIDQHVRPLVRNLGSVLFNKRYPEEFIQLIRREARCAATGEAISPTDAALRQEYNSLTSLVEQ